MSKLCLIGMGVPGFLPSRFHAGPGLRCAHFATSLARAEHELLVLYVTADHEADRRRSYAWEVAGQQVRCAAATEAELGATDVQHLIADFAPDAFVGVTTLAARLATELVADKPLWADVFGDPMAEAQAKASVHGNDFAVGRFWTTLLPVLLRGDRYSAVSRAQSDALIGQLGVAGRLGRATAGEELVSVIPCAAEAMPLAEPNATAGALRTEPALRGTILPRDAFVVLWSGSFNTWCDVDTAVAGLDRAMAVDSAIHFVATGGPVRGHDEATHERFRDLVARSRHVNRFHLLGWVAEDRLAGYYEESDVGLNVERALYERRLGSENRVAQWLAYGLPAVSTALSEFGRSLDAAGLCVRIPAGDPAALAETLVRSVAQRERLTSLRSACRQYARANLTYDHRAAPLLAWARRPSSAGDRRVERPIEIGLVSEPKAMVRLLEGYLSDLTLGQVGYRSVRWLWRRLTRG